MIHHPTYSEFEFTADAKATFRGTDIIIHPKMRLAMEWCMRTLDTKDYGHGWTGYGPDGAFRFYFRNENDRLVFKIKFGL